jgi:PPOX class probable F420-dependent enzyme
MDEIEALAKLSDARVARLATVDERHRPHLVPIVLAVLDRTIVSAVDHKPKQSSNLRRLRNIAANPHVTVLADHYDEDWRRLWWVRADGTARIVDRGRGFASAVAALRAKYAQYEHAPPAGPAIVVDIDRLTSWSGDGP